MIKLDYTIESPEERNALVDKIIAETPQEDLTPAYLEILSNYLILCMEKQEKKEKKILTDNRMTTVNKRECSFEGLVSQLENGEDGIYNLIKEDKNTIFQPKISITKKDLDTIPFLQQLRDSINDWELALKTASGRPAYTIKKALIEMRKDQYVIKQAYQKPIIFNKLTRSMGASIKLEDTSWIDEKGEAHIDGVSLMKQEVVSAVLCNYSKLKQDSFDRFDSDTYYLVQAFEQVCDKALAGFPLYMKLVECKIDGLQNVEIQSILEENFGIKHSLEYISSLWRNKIPKLIAQKAKEEYLIWHYEHNGLPLKKCSRCGQKKPAHNDFFSKNKTSKDSFYSICKCCRNKKRG